MERRLADSFSTLPVFFPKTTEAVAVNLLCPGSLDPPFFILSRSRVLGRRCRRRQFESGCGTYDLNSIDVWDGMCGRWSDGGVGRYSIRKSGWCRTLNGEIQWKSRFRAEF